MKRPIQVVDLVYGIWGRLIMLLDEFGNQLTRERVIGTTELQKAYANPNRNRQYGEWPWFVAPQSLGRLPYSLLRDIYHLSSSVRPAVDSIRREISTLPWMVINKDYKYHPPAELAEVNDFLKHPNLDRDSLAMIWDRWLLDYLVVGKGVIEKVRNPFGKVVELVNRDATLFEPKYNSLGFLSGYVEFEKNTYTPKRTHPIENIIFRHFTPNTYTTNCLPIIETIINEVAVLMLSVKAVGWALTRDEIPPGVFVLGKIGLEALERAKASFEASKGVTGETKLRVIDNLEEGANGAAWIQFTRPFREMQVAELMPMIEKIVAKNFGLSPAESGLADIPRQVADASFKSSQSKLTYPTMTVVRDALNGEVIAEFNPEAEFVYSKMPQETTKERVDAFGGMVDRGTITDNEMRVNMGFPPVQGGDSRSVKLGNERVPLDDVTGLPKYRNPAVAQNNPPNSLKSLGFTEEDFDEVFLNG